MEQRWFPCSAAALLGAVLLAGCAARRTVADVHADPARYARKPVTVAGAVSRSYGLWQWGAYQLEDASGRIWVIAARGGVPQAGTRVQVTGRALAAHRLPFLPVPETVLREEERKLR